MKKWDFRKVDRDRLVQWNSASATPRGRVNVVPLYSSV